MSELKVIKLPAALVERLAVLSMEERAAAVERGLNLSVSCVEPAPVEVGPAFAADAPVVEVKEPLVVLPEIEGRPAPETWQEISFRVHPRVARVLASVPARVRSDFVEFCLASARDTDHATRLACLQFEFARTSRSLHRLLKIFSHGEARVPHLERRLRNAIHRWGNKALDLLGEPCLDLPGIGLANAPVASRDGVPSHYEPFVLWLPARMKFQLNAIQAELVETYAPQEQKWDAYYDAAFIRPAVAEKGAEGAAPVEPVQSPESVEKTGREELTP